MAPATKDRRQQVIDSATLNGIDFVEIVDPASQTTLRVHFLNRVPVEDTIIAVTITGGETIPNVPVKPVDNSKDWGVAPDGRHLLTLHVAAPGDFSTYNLTIASKALDRFFDHAAFSFKALCPSDLDCAVTSPDCPPLTGNAPTIDYLAKDFLSFRQALTDFSALRYPDWRERSEADLGMMFLEALAALADDFSYTQDRVAAEATLETATQRRSIVRHARLVDYQPRPATVARVLLQLDVTSSPIPSGLVVSAQGPDGSVIDFETGDGLVDRTTGLLSVTTYPVNPLWNRKPGLQPYWWDDSEKCLKAKATEMWVLGHGLGLTHGVALLIETTPEITADLPQRQVIHLLNAVEAEDPLFLDGGKPIAVTHLVWGVDEALQADRDLTRTLLAGNLVPATQGRRYVESFRITPPLSGAPQIPVAVARLGPNSQADNPIYHYLYPLSNAPLAWLAQDDPQAPPLPELLLFEQKTDSAPAPWPWQRNLLDASPFESAFTIDPVRFVRITPSFGSAVLSDYDGDDGDTIRFGDGIFGDQPDEQAVFQMRYRVGSGAAGNVAAETITYIPSNSAGLITAVFNPFPASGGAEAESIEQVRRLAPQQFRYQPLRAVRPEDYRAAAQSLAWVQRAGTVFRWTGSWLTVFTTPDPKDSETVTTPEQIDLIDLLNRRRLAGYESYAPLPIYISLDLIVQVCVRPDAFRGDVARGLLAALSATRNRHGQTGFFHVDRFTFGMSLERSALDAAIQAVPGVAGVISIRYRQQGRVLDYIPLPETVTVAATQILRLDNDPSRPERGSLKVLVEGGK